MSDIPRNPDLLMSSLVWRSISGRREIGTHTSVVIDCKRENIIHVHIFTISMNREHREELRLVQTLNFIKDTIKSDLIHDFIH